MTELTISLKTLTPLWTGGVDQSCDRLHETGLIGSLRWWYEALVRGLGGYACDPTSDGRCTFASKAYEKAKGAGSSGAVALHEGTKSLCAGCYLFGCTGWARLFRLRTAEAPTKNLHFCTTLEMNKGWLERVFAGSSGGIGSAQVPYGDVRVEFSTRGQDENYTRGQFALVLRLAAEYGGVGARLQHGFGQVSLGLPSELQVDRSHGIKQLTEKLRGLRLTGPDIDTPFNLQHFVGLTYRVSARALSAFAAARFVVGTKPNSANYLPCIFDLRYKGSDKWGMRQWLKLQGWRESDDSDKLEELDLLLGPRSQWGPKFRQTQIDERLRRGSRIFFGMPHQEKAGDDNYELRIWAFWHHDLEPRLQTPEALRNLCQEYIAYVFGKAAEMQSLTSGQEILSKLGAE
jgi:CRISPR type III-B/RAMP module RAMP protein Cmr1